MGADGCHPRSFVLEASNDSVVWKLLDCRENVNDLNDRFVTRNFPVSDCVGESFRSIRLRQTGKNHWQDDHLAISAFDIFGTIYAISNHEPEGIEQCKKSRAKAEQKHQSETENREEEMKRRVEEAEKPIEEMKKREEEARQKHQIEMENREEEMKSLGFRLMTFNTQGSIFTMTSFPLMSEGEDPKISALKEGAILIGSQQEGLPQIYKLKETELAKSTNVRRVVVGLRNEEAQAKRDLTFLVSGETGSGKTTWVNGFANFLYGVQFEDPFRIKVVTEADEGQNGDQTKSQTSEVTEYRFEWQPWFPVPYNIVLIDTPGFADVKGLEQDKVTVESIKRLFTEMKVDHLSAVALVVKASVNRLTAVEHYVFHSIVSMFAADIAENFVLVATHGSSQKGDFENLENLLRSAEPEPIPFQKVVGFENNVLFDVIPKKKRKKRKSMRRGFKNWEDLVASYMEIVNLVARFPEKSLVNTREVLQRRQKLEDVLEALHRISTIQLRYGVSN